VRGEPTLDRDPLREALARLRDRRRILATAKKEALAEVRAVRVRHRPGTAADQARLAAELAPIVARLKEIGREQEAVDAAAAALRRGGGGG